jgi:membrane protease YdiL (CAAX protease family)
MIDVTTAMSEKRRPIYYFALAYLISWLIWMPLVASSQNWISAGAPFILFYLGTAGPTLAALMLLQLDQGKEGVWLLLRRLFMWRVGLRWYMIAIFLPVGVRATALGLLYLFGYISLDFSLKRWQELLGIFLLMVVLVPFEEIGWRGYALPRLQSLWGALWASVILGTLWSSWHLPLIWIKGSYQESQSPLTYILVFTVTILPISVLFTWIYNHTKGSLFLASVFHASINISDASLIIPDENGKLVLMIECVFNCILAGIAIRLGLQGYRNNITAAS